MNDAALRFRQAVGPHLGRELTPEVAAAIEMAALHAPATPIDVTRFPAVDHDEVVIRAERFVDALEELTPLHAAHWTETEKWRADLAMRPDYAVLLDRERAGRLLQVTARRDGELVGHVRMFVHRSLHTSTEYGDEDTLYIRPEHRGGMLVMRMMRYAEACLLALGVREIRANSKLVNRADVLMRRLGYEPVALQFCKIFPEEPHHEPSA